MEKKTGRKWQRSPLVIPASGTAYAPANLTPATRRLLRQTEFNAMVQKINGLDWQGGKNKLLHSIGAWALYRLTLSDDPPDFSQPFRDWHEDARLAWERARRVASIVDLMRHDVNAAVEATLALGLDVAEAELEAALNHAKIMAGRKMEGVDALATALVAAGARTVTEIAKELFDRGEEWTHGPWKFEVDSLGPEGAEYILDPEGVTARELRTWRVEVAFGGKPARPVSLRTLEERCKGRRGAR